MAPRSREKKLERLVVPPTPSFVSSLGGFSWCIYFKRTMDDDERSEAMMRPKKSFPYPGPVQAAEKDGTSVCVTSRIR